jgi:excinuclease ABC subunit C
MVNSVNDFDIILTNNEKEALLLEINLIHKYYPKFNIMLKDCKSYPYITIKNDVNPYLAIERLSKRKRKNVYYGPYPNSNYAHSIMELLNKIYPLRKCETVPKRACLYYHLHQCLGPCINKIDNSKYTEIERDIQEFFRGKYSDIIKKHKILVKEYSKSLEFEKAQQSYEIIQKLEAILTKQKVHLKEYINMDVFNYVYLNNILVIYILNYQEGLLINSDTITLDSIDFAEDILKYITEYYSKNKVPKQVILPDIDALKLLENVIDAQIVFPKKGSKFELLKMCAENALKSYQNSQIYYAASKDMNLLLDELGQLLHISNLRNIEMIDNSQLQGDSLVSGVVVFTNGVPNKAQYRKYNLDNLEHTDDYHLMIEVLQRRFKRILNEGNKVNELLIVDGGVIQIKAAKIIKEQLKIPIVIAGLVKDEKHRTKYLIDENEQIVQIENIDLVHLLTRIQDEVHRFAITFHRQKRRANLIVSQLDKVEGIGEKRKLELLRVFKSYENILNTDDAELLKVIPQKIIDRIKGRNS